MSEELPDVIFAGKWPHGGRAWRDRESDAPSGAKPFVCAHAIDDIIRDHLNMHNGKDMNSYRAVLGVAAAIDALEQNKPKP